MSTTPVVMDELRVNRLFRDDTDRVQEGISLSKSSLVPCVGLPSALNWLTFRIPPIPLVYANLLRNLQEQL